MSFDLPRYRAPDFAGEIFVNAPDARTEEAEMAGVAPEGFHATSIYPEYFRIGGVWRLITGARMDCVPVLRGDGSLDAVEFRRLKAGDRVIVGRSDDGSEGVYLHTKGFANDDRGAVADSFAFRSGRSRETSFTGDYERLASLLRHDAGRGYIVWTLGPAAVFDQESRRAMQYIVENGYCHAVFGGNAVATHDLEAAMFGTALGQDLDTGENVRSGHYNHLDLLNRAVRAGSVRDMIAAYGLSDGLIRACVANDVPFVLAGSIRDDGPLPEVIRDAARAQDMMRAHTSRATTVVCLGTQLHSIATGNLTPCYAVTEEGVRPVFIYAVDISEFALNKLRNRGSLEVTTIVSNIQDFLFKVVRLLEGEEAARV
jgi:lysine-ketoglutarate reductase/saccharopine dehydrogenase-like protein (TIGR00300 family)